MAAVDDSLLVTVAKRLVRFRWDDAELYASEELRRWCREDPETVRRLLDILALFVDALEELLSESGGEATQIGA